jgi:hypothetical protein
MSLHYLTIVQGIAAASILSGIIGTALLYHFSDSQNAPQGYGSGPAMFKRVAKRLPWVRAGFLLLMLSFVLQGGALALTPA